VGPLSGFGALQSSAAVCTISLPARVGAGVAIASSDPLACAAEAIQHVTATITATRWAAVACSFSISAAAAQLPAPSAQKWPLLMPPMYTPINSAPRLPALPLPFTTSATPSPMQSLPVPGAVPSTLKLSPWQQLPLL